MKKRILAIVIGALILFAPIITSEVKSQEPDGDQFFCATGWVLVEDDVWIKYYYCEDTGHTIHCWFDFGGGDYCVLDN